MSSMKPNWEFSIFSVYRDHGRIGNVSCHSFRLNIKFLPGLLHFGCYIHWHRDIVLTQNSSEHVNLMEMKEKIGTYKRTEYDVEYKPRKRFRAFELDAYMPCFKIKKRINGMKYTYSPNIEVALPLRYYTQ